ncbi:hypothetical protein SAMN05421852_105167 [Thermoflavimicrobium dichotomicum]|uniref:Uncharacterized protein n=1 Tax=Thermoflavimicrobium dichotomicum TaxID=46223 RepID=A0A1I3PBP5_9BACL|nr:hypothetical protein SAMN05421852_105167 [Thermoflavimicrobium dichotomicum]
MIFNILKLIQLVQLRLILKNLVVGWCMGEHIFLLYYCPRKAHMFTRIIAVRSTLKIAFLDIGWA